MLKLLLAPTEFALDAAPLGGAPHPGRTLTGMAVPYGVISNPTSDGRRVMFYPGSLSAAAAPKLYLYHDDTRPVGLVSEWIETPDGVLYVAKISATAEGDDALTLCLDKVLTAVSVGVDILEYTIDAAGVWHVTAAIWKELSLLPYGAFPAASIDTVAAIEGIPQSGAEHGKNNNQELTAKDDTMTTELLTAEVATLKAEFAAAQAATLAATVATAPLYAQPKRTFRMPSASEWIAAYHIGGAVLKNTQDAYVAAANVNSNPLQAAAGDVLTTDIVGLLPVPILGPVFEDINFMRPVINALGARPMPSTMSKTFIRPTISTHVSVGEQTENTTVSRTTIVVADNVVTKKTVAGGASLTYQTLDFSDPAAISIVLNDLAGVYMDATDNIAADALLVAATSSGVWDLTLADLLKSVWDSATDIAATTNFLPTHIFVDPLTWSLIGQLVDGQGRPVFHNLLGGGQSVNSFGEASPAIQDGSVLGLKLVVDKNFAAKTMVICNSKAFEVYEERKGMVSVENAQKLARDISLYGYLATFKANATMIRKITQA